MSLRTVDEITLVNALEILEAERKLRELRIAEQEALTAKAVAERDAQQMVAANVEKARETEHELRALQLTAQKAATKKSRNRASHAEDRS